MNKNLVCALNSVWMLTVDWHELNINKRTSLTGGSGGGVGRSYGAAEQHRNKDARPAEDGVSQCMCFTPNLCF